MVFFLFLIMNAKEFKENIINQLLKTDQGGIYKTNKIKINNKIYLLVQKNSYETTYIVSLYINNDYVVSHIVRSCPFLSDRLKDSYMRDRMTIDDIVELANLLFRADKLSSFK